MEGRKGYGGRRRYDDRQEATDVQEKDEAEWRRESKSRDTTETLAPVMTMTVDLKLISLKECLGSIQEKMIMYVTTRIKIVRPIESRPVSCVRLANTLVHSFLPFEKS